MSREEQALRVVRGEEGWMKLWGRGMRRDVGVCKLEKGRVCRSKESGSNIAAEDTHTYIVYPACRCSALHSAPSWVCAA